MPKYLIEASHEPTYQACVRVLKAFEQAGAHYLLRADWGCKAGVHSAWIIVEAENEHDARLVVPPVVRSSARVVQLNKYTPEEVKNFHEEDV
jgi:hypothetical protein